MATSDPEAEFGQGMFVLLGRDSAALMDVRGSIQPPESTVEFETGDVEVGGMLTRIQVGPTRVTLSFVVTPRRGSDGVRYRDDFPAGPRGEPHPDLVRLRQLVAELQELTSRN